MGLICNLKTHEMERKAKEEKAPQKKNNLAFKATPIFSDDDEENEQEVDKELTP